MTLLCKALYGLKMLTMIGGALRCLMLDSAMTQSVRMIVLVPAAARNSRTNWVSFLLCIRCCSSWYSLSLSLL